MMFKTARDSRQFSSGKKLMKIQKLLEALNELLEPEKFRDYCPNGLQVQGKKEVKNIVCGVSASEALINEAVKRDADTIIVHHGYFWKNENPRIIRH